MSQADKVLDILALASLPEHAKIARLAAQKIGKPFTMEHALAVVRTYFGDSVRGRTAVVAQDLFDEKDRQERLHNDRQAVKDAAKRLDLPYTTLFRPEVVGADRAERMRKNERIRHAQQAFGADVEGNFNEDTLALMSLIHGDMRRYTVSWLDGGSRPIQAAVIEVGVMVDGIFEGQHRALLYKHLGRTMVAGTGATTVRDALAGQVPHKLVTMAAELREAGCKIVTDFASQEMVVTTPEGDEKRLPWTGRTVQ